MRGWTLGLMASASCLAAGVLMSCSTGTDCDFRMCAAAEGAGDGGVASNDGSTDVKQPDACSLTPTAPGCVTDDVALFVNGLQGDDTSGDGTRTKPYRSLSAALGKVSGAKKRIFVCEGTYLEDVAMTSAHAGVSIVGGVSCAWEPSPARPVFGKSISPLKVEGANDVSFRDVEFHAADATAAGESSIAAFVTGSKVTFTGVTLKAGAATAKGATGALTPFNMPSDTDLHGVEGSAGGGDKNVTCPDGQKTKGGKGGPVGGFPGESGTPGPDNGNSLAACAANQGGGNGVVGTSHDAASGALRVGQLDGSGWHPEVGSPGMSGGPGQGGGGGASAGGGVGGGGGAGGCGGAGGGGGGGGGASIAFASFQSSVTLATSTLVAANAADGGDGAAGQAGMTNGGARGAGTATSCNGGNGGPGGHGASGGGGAGGVSIGVLYKGTAPALDAATTAAITVGMKGKPGGGEKPGIDGAAVPILETP